MGFSASGKEEAKPPLPEASVPKCREGWGPARRLGVRRVWGELRAALSLLLISQYPAAGYHIVIRMSRPSTIR